MPARTYNLLIDNQTDFELSRTNHHLCHGEWTSEPPATIPAHTMGAWRSESGGDIPLIGSIGTGTEGWVKYRVNNANQDLMYLYWDNPFALGKTFAKGVLGDVPADCDEPAGSVFRHNVETALEIVMPAVPESNGASGANDPSTFAVVYMSGPAVVWLLDGIRPHASTACILRNGAPPPKQEPIEFLAIPPTEISPQSATPPAAWTADWLYTPANWARPMLIISIRENFDGGYFVSVEDRSGHKPGTAEIASAQVVGGFSIPYKTEVLTFPDEAAVKASKPRLASNKAVMLQPHGASPPPLSSPVRQIKRATAGITPKAIFAARLVDRMYLSERSALESYGEHEENSATVVRYWLRFLRWDADGQTQVDVLMKRHDILK